VPTGGDRRIVGRAEQNPRGVTSWIFDRIAMALED